MESSDEVIDYLGANEGAKLKEDFYLPFLLGRFFLKLLK